MDEKNIPVQNAAEHTTMNKSASNVVQQAGGQVHHDEQVAEKMAQTATDHANVPQTNVPAQQFATQQNQTQTEEQPKKKTLLEVLFDVFSLKWFKSNMRNKYGEDINKVRSTREEERTTHIQKNPPQKFGPPQANVVQPAEGQTNSQPTTQTPQQPTTPPTTPPAANPSQPPGAADKI